MNEIKIRSTEDRLEPEKWMITPAIIPRNRPQALSGKRWIPHFSKRADNKEERHI